MGKILRGENIIQVVDMKDDDAYRRGDATRRMLVDVGGYRSMLNIALRKEVAGRAGALPEPPGHR